MPDEWAAATWTTWTWTTDATWTPGALTRRVIIAAARQWRALSDPAKLICSKPARSSRASYGEGNRHYALVRAEPGCRRRRGPRVNPGAPCFFWFFPLSAIIRGGAVGELFLHRSIAREFLPQVPPAPVAPAPVAAPVAREFLRQRSSSTGRPRELLRHPLRAPAAARPAPSSSGTSGRCAPRCEPSSRGSERRSPQTPQRGFGKGRNPNLTAYPRSPQRAGTGGRSRDAMYTTFRVDRFPRYIARSARSRTSSFRVVCSG